MIDILKSLLYGNTSVIWKLSAVSQWCCYLIGHLSLASLPMTVASFVIANCLGHCRYEFLLNKIYKECQQFCFRVQLATLVSSRSQIPICLLWTVVQISIQFLKPFQFPYLSVPVAEKLGFNCIVPCTSSLPVSREEKMKWASGVDGSVCCSVAPLNRREVPLFQKVGSWLLGGSTGIPEPG